jgi:signal transduction histidine kinase/ActR/RegA family two-component response regulator
MAAAVEAGGLVFRWPLVPVPTTDRGTYLHLLRQNDRPGAQKFKDKGQMQILGDLFNILETDPVRNISAIVRYTGEALDCAFALYTRLDEESNSLVCQAGHNLPPDFPDRTSPDGCICYETIIKNGSLPIAVEDLAGTPFEISDPQVRQYRLKSYLGFPVHCNGSVIGALAAFDTRSHDFTPSDVDLISTLSKALSLEEERLRKDAEAQNTEMERNRLSARLQQTQKMEAIATLAGGIAHQFNNALAVILGNLELIHMDSIYDPKLDVYAEPINQAAQKMVQLTGQLLAYARGGRFQTQSISARRFVTETLSIVRHSMAPYVEVETDLDPQTNNIDVDLTQMQMLMAAILANASEAVETQGRVSITLKNVQVRKRELSVLPGMKAGRWVLLRIADNGKGMDKQTRDRIFEPFFTTKFQGRGLGMAAVYGIVKKHGGYVYVNATPDGGTAVSIYLPGTAPIRAAAEPAMVSPVQRTGTALIVEDEHLVMEVNRAIVEKLGYRVLEAKTGKEALAIVDNFEGEIDFTLLDVILPDMDGSLIYPKLKKARPGLKVVVCSGFALDGAASEMLEAGAESFIQKPFTMASLSAVLDKIFKNSSQ